jgi:uncharacterized integral membrane protein (TIGR00698 family)
MRNYQKIFLLIGAGLCFFPFMQSSLSLLLGIAFGLVVGSPFTEKTNKWGSLLLRSSIVGLGFGINTRILFEASKDNFGTTVFFVFFALLAGYLLGKAFAVDKIISLLISVGTAICGGSAIAAVSPIVKANSNQLTLSTGTIFLLNALALFIFPFLGHRLGLSQQQFGTWAAIAIHDTSSVVGSAANYGEIALETASITKMLRIVWIIPVSLLLAFSIKENRETFKVPLFIVGFVAASVLYSSFPQWQSTFSVINRFSKQLMVVSLFLIGSGISYSALKNIGGKVLLQATTLWLLVSALALFYVLKFV